MKSTILTPSDLGGYLRGRLAAARSDTAFGARCAHLGAIRREGLRVASPLGDIYVHEATTAETIAASVAVAHFPLD